MLKLLNKSAPFFFLFFLFLSLLIAPSISYSSQEKIHAPHEITLVVNAGAPFGEVKVTIRASQSKDIPEKITSIDLWLDGKDVKIPEIAFVDLEAPLLGSTQIRSEIGYDKNPWVYIYFELAYRMENGQWRPKRVHIAYQDGRIKYRAIETPHPDGSYTWKKDDL